MNEPFCPIIFHPLLLTLPHIGDMEGGNKHAAVVEEKEGRQ